MELAKAYDCTGCGACEQKCPQKAIFFADDHEGFPTPHIQKDKCIECGLCNKVCPAINMPRTNPIREAYAVQLLDKSALRESTSGGVFSALAKEILSRGGVVYGCIWNKDCKAVVCRADTEKGINPMHGSKYVWSWAGDTFPEIKNCLERGTSVLFSGLPCQAAGLRNFLGKEYDNLFILSFFCGGAPSPLAFHKYLRTITKSIPLSQLDFKFRDKTKEGVGIHISYNTKYKRKYESYVANSFFYAYAKKTCHRLSCYHCQYRYKDRIEDITMGDYWGIEKYHSEFDINDGVSAVLINSNKGQSLFKAASKDLKVSVTDHNNIAKGNNLTLDERRIEFNIPECREEFFRTLKEHGWVAADRKYLWDRERTRLWVRSVIPKSIKKILKKLGFH